MADGVEALLDGEGVERSQRQGQQQGDAAIQGGEGLRVGAVDFLRGAANGGGIGHSPMRGDGLAGPDGADFFGRVIADGKDEVEMGRAGLGKLVPGLAAQAFHAETGGGDLAQSFGANGSGGMTAGAVGGEGGRSFAVEDRFRQDGAGGVAGAEKQNIVVRHVVSLSALVRCNIAIAVLRASLDPTLRNEAAKDGAP